MAVYIHIWVYMTKICNTAENTPASYACYIGEVPLTQDGQFWLNFDLSRFEWNMIAGYKTKLMALV